MVSLSPCFLHSCLALLLAQYGSAPSPSYKTRRCRPAGSGPCPGHAALPGLAQPRQRRRPRPPCSLHTPRKFFTILRRPFLTLLPWAGQAGPCGLPARLAPFTHRGQARPFSPSFGDKAHSDGRVPRPHCGVRLCFSPPLGSASPRHPFLQP